MSDKFFMHDCNSYTHTCQNTYRAECRDSKVKVDKVEEVTDKAQKSLKWWQRLWERQPHHATT